MNGIIQGMDGLVKALNGLATGCAAARQKAGRRIGQRCVTVYAKRNAPKSPTKKQHSKTLKRKRITARKGFFPGGLERSIAYEVQPSGDVSVFVAKNSPAGAYAKRIHDEKGVTWHKRGAGTVAKGAQADEKFIERAVNEHVDEYRKVLEQEIDRELRGL